MTDKARASTQRPLEKGYKPRPIAEGYGYKPQRGYQPTGTTASPKKPPSNPPNQGTAVKK